jgi:uncharacterized membrane protein
MAFCSNCGAEVQGRFCAKCGTPMAAPAGAGAGPSAGTSAPPPPPNPSPGYSNPGYANQGYSNPPYANQQPQGAPAQAAGMEENVACALCYALGLLTGVLFLVLAPYNQNRLIKFHAFQSIFLNLAWIVLFIAISIISIALLPIPFLGAMLSLVLHLGAFLGMFILWLMLMYKAYNRERWVLPVIGPLAEKQA